MSSLPNGWEISRKATERTGHWKNRRNKVRRSTQKHRLIATAPQVVTIDFWALDGSVATTKVNTECPLLFCDTHWNLKLQLVYLMGQIWVMGPHPAVKSYREPVFELCSIRCERHSTQLNFRKFKRKVNKTSKYPPYLSW